MHAIKSRTVQFASGQPDTERFRDLAKEFRHVLFVLLMHNLGMLLDNIPDVPTIILLFGASYYVTACGDILVE